MQDEKKNKITKSGLSKVFKLYKYISPYRREYFLGLFFLLVSSLANLTFPKLLGDLVNAGSGEDSWANLNQIALVLGIVLLVQATFSYFRIILFNNVTEKSLALLRRDTFNHLIKLPITFFEKHRVGELNSRISADISLLQETLTTTLAELIRQLIIIIGGVTLLAFTSVKLTLFMLIILPPTMIVARFFGKFIRKFSKDVQKNVADSNTIVEETLQGIQSVKSFTNEAYEIDRYFSRTEDIKLLGMKSGKYRAMFSSFIIFGMFGAIVAVIWRGSLMLSTGGINSGQLFSFVIYSVYVGGTIGGLAAVFANIQKFIGATETLFELHEEDEEEIITLNEISEENQIQGQLELVNLSFAYPSRPETKVLKNINLTINKNQTIAIVGGSGAGKSTLAALLLQMHETNEGAILFDQRPNNEFNVSALRKQIALVPQDVFLFGGTIRENIAYGRPNASDADILAAAKNANALEFIERFEEGFETLVGERGTQLSGGQRQRIAIARAILKDPKILILDEATSSLDSASEKLVQEALDTLMKGRTSLIIAHRLSTIRKADTIVVLEHGEITERGTHDELMKNPNGTYRKLSELQFSV
ncbi:ABC transporter ATP-binding protein [Saccharicrinis aurantiacus]|uniref:ABC transporter ATP-binding protein n=1 Tax=Saccharicrinis aurantiacus TaxID=1849719 RepID=UPI002493B93A|nr:ABC transporter transmembrane domain-containing protein [Saccharicrinis aurantiacus]